MPAKPRRRVDVRRVEEARRARLAAAGFRALEPLARDFAGRDLLAVDRLRDLFDVDRGDLVSPFSLRILFTVLAATSSAEFAAGGDRLPVDAVLEDHAVVIYRELSGETT